MEDQVSLEQFALNFFKRANLPENVKLQFNNPYSFDPNEEEVYIDAFFYSSYDKTIFMLYPFALQEFQTEQSYVPIYEELVNENKLDFYTYYKISLAHEMGHAKQQESLYEQLTLMINDEDLHKINSMEELLNRYQSYKSFVYDMEQEAWILAWDLLKENTDRYVFEAMRDSSLETYVDAVIEDDEYFVERYIELLALQNEKLQ